MAVCKTCGKELTGRQTMFCCTAYKQAFYKQVNNGVSYNSAYSQKKDAHGFYLKYKLILARGGKCECCGYDKNIAALQFHHKNPEEKLFTLDARTIERKHDDEIIKEFNKCILLCSNCHMELHHPELVKENYEKFKEAGQGINYKVPHDLADLNID